MVSRVGSVISFIGTILFFYILIESFVLQRPVLYSHYVSSSVEWRHNFPPSSHTYTQLGIMVI